MITRVDTYLYRGPRPDTMDEIKANGIKHVINLEVGYFEWFHHEAGAEQAMCEQNQVTYEHYPLSDICSPTKSQADQIICQIIKYKLLGEKVLVHCLHGQDRTGWIIAGWNVEEMGWTVDKAIENMLQMGFHVFPYKYLGWIEELKEYLG